MNIGMGRW